MDRRGRAGSVGRGERAPADPLTPERAGTACAPPYPHPLAPRPVRDAPGSSASGSPEQDGKSNGLHGSALRRTVDAMWINS
ncbi:hypothetical protein Pve01_12720 [Planomonospora venezuelensis]|nr:hypothetical protein Pve01_12720 [Planomonospora venezuelensis]